MNLKAVQKVESKERILNVASRLFKKNGYAATGIDEIMAEAGLTAGGFYAHFKSKKDLLEQAVDLALKKSTDLLMKDSESLIGADKINFIMKKYASSAHRDLVEKGCILPALGSEIYRTSKISRKPVTDYIEKWAKAIVIEWPEAISSDEKNKKALGLISQAVGAILLSRLVESPSLSENLLKSVSCD